MPEGEEDISWSWIKEALPSMQLTKVLHTLWHPVIFNHPVSSQEIFRLVMFLARPSQCKLTSLDVFDDDIPQVSKYEAYYSLTRRKQTLSRLARGCRKTWQWSRLWWGEGEGNMTTSTLRILPAVSMSELCCQIFFYFEKHDCNILNVHLFWNRYPDNGGYSQLKYSQLKIYFSQTVDPWLVSFEYFFTECQKQWQWFVIKFFKSFITEEYISTLKTHKSWILKWSWQVDMGKSFITEEDISPPQELLPHWLSSVPLKILLVLLKNIPIIFFTKYVKI